MSLDERDEYANLILLCRDHHKLVDDQPNTYTAEVLHRYKGEHEATIRNSQGFDASRQRDDELYASYIDEWASRVDLTGWTEWTSHLLTEDEPWMTAARADSLAEAHRWLLSRVWPERYAELNAVFQNFGCILKDLLRVFHEHDRVAGENDELLVTPRFYKIPYFDEHLYERLLKAYKFHLEMIADLTLELTRAANYVCDQTRKYMSRSYRLGEGKLVVQTGFLMEPASRQVCPEYCDQERVLKPYPGLEVFREIRSTRDVHFQWHYRPTLGWVF